MPVYYSLIARKNVVLCDYSSAAVSLEELSLRALDNLGPSDERRSQYVNTFKVFTLVDHGLTYLCVTDKDFTEPDGYHHLEEIKQEFRAAGLHRQALSCAPYALRVEFGSKLQRLNSRACGDKVSDLQARVDTVQNVMTRNIEKLTERGESLADLEGRSEELAVTSTDFHRTTTKLRKKMMWKSIKLWVIFIIVLIIILAIIVGVIVVVLSIKKKI